MWPNLRLKVGHTSRDVLAHNATLLAVTVLTFLQCCVKLHHLHGNKRPRARRACPGREAVQRQTAGENRAEQPGRATDTTNIQPNNNGLIDGADKRLAQSTPHTCAHLSAHTHTRHAHKTLASYQPQNQAPAPSQSWLLLRLLLRLLLPPVVVLPELVVLLWILDVRFTVKRTEKGDKERCETETRERGKRGSLCEHWFTCVVGSSEYAFRHFWSRSLAHSEFLPWAVPCVSMPPTTGLNHTYLIMLTVA